MAEHWDWWDKPVGERLAIYLDREYARLKQPELSTTTEQNEVLAWLDEAVLGRNREHIEPPSTGPANDCCQSRGCNWPKEACVCPV